MIRHKVNIDARVFNDAYLPYLDDMARIQIYFGGSSSGKSKFVAQRHIVDILRGARNFLVTRKVGKSLRGSVIPEIVAVINEWGLQSQFTINKTDGTITCANGYQIVFVGLDDTEKLKSIRPAKGVFTDIWCEEATEDDYTDIKQLLKRQRGGDPLIHKRLVLTFNPILQSHWIFEQYFKTVGWADKQTEYQKDGLSILKTWYIHNRFLTPDDVRDLENETDQYYYNVYTLGNWGVLGNVIFKNWRVEDLSGMLDQFTNHRNGLDFGFASDPVAGWYAHYDKAHRTIYLYDETYERGLTNDILAERIKDKIKDRLIVCDSAEPKSIAELQRYGVNAIGAKKGKDSVLHGIQWLQQQTVIIDTHCINARNEFSTFHWKEDAGGNALPIPVDKDNHLIDAARYAHEFDSLEADATIVTDPYEIDNPFNTEEGDEWQ